MPPNTLKHSLLGGECKMLKINFFHTEIFISRFS